jgi:hypothetical protein
MPYLGPLLREGRIKPAERLGKGAAAPLVAGSPGGGQLVTSPLLSGNGSGPVRLDVLRGTAFALVGVDVDPATMLSEASQDLWCRAGARCITVGADELPGVRPGSVVIVRPDHFVRDVVPAPKLDAATTAFFKTAADRPEAALAR